MTINYTIKCNYNISSYIVKTIKSLLYRWYDDQAFTFHFDKFLIETMDWTRFSTLKVNHWHRWFPWIIFLFYSSLQNWSNMYKSITNKYKSNQRENKKELNTIRENNNYKTKNCIKLHMSLESGATIKLIHNLCVN